MASPGPETRSEIGRNYAKSALQITPKGTEAAAHGVEMGSAASIRAAPLGRLSVLPEAVLEHLMCLLDGASLCALCRCCRTLSSTDTDAVWEELLRRELGLWPAGRTLAYEGSARHVYASLCGRDAEVFDAELLSRRVRRTPAVAAEPWLWTLGVRLELRNPYPCATWFLFGARPASGASLFSGAAPASGAPPRRPGSGLTLSLAAAPTCRGYREVHHSRGLLSGEGGGIVLMSLRLCGDSREEAGHEVEQEAWALLLPPYVPPWFGDLRVVGGGGESGGGGGGGEGGDGSSDESEAEEASAPPDVVLANHS